MKRLLGDTRKEIFFFFAYAFCGLQPRYPRSPQSVLSCARERVHVGKHRLSKKSKKTQRSKVRSRTRVSVRAPPRRREHTHPKHLPTSTKCLAHPMCVGDGSPIRARGGEGALYRARSSSAEFNPFEPNMGSGRTFCRELSVLEYQLVTGFPRLGFVPKRIARRVDTKIEQRHQNEFVLS